MLTVKQRQKYLSALGYYKGAIDGIVGVKTKAAYLTLQKEYFVNSIDIDGIYGADTEALLISAYNIKKHCKNFSLREFRCRCGGMYCSGYPAALNASLLANIQKLRDKVGAITITSGLRCEVHNKAVGGIANSRHLIGKAADIYSGLNRTEQGRITLMHYWRAFPDTNYTYCNIKGSNPNMGNAVHIDVK